jgi:hypothetical protein
VGNRFVSQHYTYEMAGLYPTVTSVHFKLTAGRTPLLPCHSFLSTSTLDSRHLTSSPQTQTRPRTYNATRPPTQTAIENSLRYDRCLKLTGDARASCQLEKAMANVRGGEEGGLYTGCVGGCTCEDGGGRAQFRGGGSHGSQL